MSEVKAMQFDGTFGSAKEICAWVGDPDKAICGPWDHFKQEAEAAGGFDLVTQVNDAPFYTSAAKGDWVVKGPDGNFIIFTDAQYKVAFPS